MKMYSALILITLVPICYGFDIFNMLNLLQESASKYLGKYYGTIKQTMSAAIEKDCVFKCKNGLKPKPKLGYKPVPNGCGVPGLNLNNPYVPYTKLTECCNTHDICYGTCRSDKEECDKEFQKCLYKICKTVKDINMADQACKGLAKTLYSATMVMGCKFYLDGQSQSCTCNYGEL